MQLLENLKKIGVPSETLNIYIEKGMIKSNGLGTWQIVDGDLLITLIIKCIACKISPDFLLIPEFDKEHRHLLEILYAHLTNQNYMMACTAAEKLNKELHTQQLDLFIDTCKKYNDPLTYILKKEDYGHDKATIEGLHKIERKLLLQLELFENRDAQDTYEMLQEFYSDFETYFKYNVPQLFRILSEMSQDHLQIGNSCEEVFSGLPGYVLNMLLEFDDIYRADELISSELKKDHYSIEWQIYYTIMYQIRLINERNLQNAIGRTIVDAGIDEDNTWAFPQETYPILTKEEVRQIKKGKNIELDDTDYYSEYENALFETGDYDYAKECLEKYQKQEALSLGSDIYDYLFEEIECLQENKDLGVDMKEYNTAFQFVTYYMNLEDYDTALNYAAKCYNMLKVENPRIACILGKIYYKKNDISKAAHFYSEAIKNPVSPDDLADMVEVFFKNGEYYKVLNAVERFDYYDAMQNSKVHYIAAATYLKLGKFNDSRKELEVCTDILTADDNLPIEFAEEREIIDDAEKGKNKSFGLDDYIDYNLTDDEYEISAYLDQNIEEAERVFSIIKNDEKNYANNLKYILSVIKVLFQSFDYDTALNFCERLDEVLDTNLLSQEDAKVMKKMINNLKRI